MGPIVAIVLITGSCLIVVGLSVAIIVRQRVHRRRIAAARERRRQELLADPRYQKRRQRAREMREWERHFKDGA